MTTPLIEATSSAPTLREMAAIEFVRAERAYEEERVRRREEVRRTAVGKVTGLLASVLGIVDAEIVVTGGEHDFANDLDVRAHDVSSDLWFTARRNISGMDRLCVLVVCDKGCGKELWVEIDGLTSLAFRLNTEQAHAYDEWCLEQFDDQGEPITDRMGNPLPPRAPFIPRPTPEEKARQSIVALENAAERVAHALNLIARLEDSRALIKPEAIKRLIESGAASSATAAEKIVERDEQYIAHRERQRDAEIEKWGALAAYEASKLSAQLDVALAATLIREES